MLNVTTMNNATTVLAAVNAEITVVAARIVVVARAWSKRLDFWLFSKHCWSHDHQGEPGIIGYLCCPGYQPGLKQPVSRMFGSACCPPGMSGQESEMEQGRHRGQFRSSR